MNKAELIEALEIAVGNYDFDGEYEKSAKVSVYIEKIKLDTYSTRLREASASYVKALAEEELTGEAVASMERKYWEGYLDSLEAQA